MKYFHTIAITFLFVFSGCHPADPLDEQFIKTEGVFVLNEGNFTYGNASLSFIDLEKNQIENQVFFRANGFPLGDIACSMTLVDDQAFICVNYSGKVFIMNSTTFKHAGTISGLTSPRYFAFLEAGKAYVSDLYAEEITIINPADLTITGTIQTGCSTEQLIRWKDYIFTNNWSYGNKILKIDIRTDLVVDSLIVPLQPNSMVMDRDEHLWVLSDGGYPGSIIGNEIPALTVIDPNQLNILRQIEFPGLANSPNNLHINQSGDTLFFLSTGWSGEFTIEPGIYRMPVSSQGLPENAWIPEGDKRFYALGIDPETSTVYASDAKDYLQSGMIFRYRSDGVLIDSLPADRIPGFFAFKSNKN